MNEAGVWQTIRKGLITKNIHLTRIESSAGNGVPDISYGIPQCNGWIELKYIAEWPKRPTTKVKLPLRPEQKLWIQTRGALSGNIWVFIRIQDDFFLLPHYEAINACEGWVKEEWIRRTSLYGYWEKRVNYEELYIMLKEGC